MIKTTVRKISLTTEYSQIVPSDLKIFMMMQIVVPTGGITYKFNDDTEEISKVEGKYFTHPLNLPANTEGCGDLIYMKATSEIDVMAEIQYGE